MSYFSLSRLTLAPRSIVGSLLSALTFIIKAWTLVINLSNGSLLILSGISSLVFRSIRNIYKDLALALVSISRFVLVVYLSEYLGRLSSMLVKSIVLGPLV